MKYLFFDIENANCQDNCCKMFSFGYVVADENLNIITEHTDLLMNPDVKQWDWFVLKRVTSYTRNEIIKYPNFVKRYDKIKKLIEEDNTIAVGFSTLDDIGYLMDACKRYNLDPFKIKFFDIQRVCAKLNNHKIKSLGFEYLSWCEKLGANQHRSDFDALYTYEVTKAVCQKEGKTLQELMISEEYAMGHTEQFAYGYNCEEIISREDKRIRTEQKKIARLETRLTRYIERVKNKTNYIIGTKDNVEDYIRKDYILKGSKNDILFIRYLDNVEINKEAQGVFAGKKISISLNYELYNFRNMIKLIKLIADNGGEYIKKASLGDYFVSYDLTGKDGEELPDNKLKFVKEAIESGKQINIISFDELLNKLGITYEQLNEMPDIDLSYLEDAKYGKKK